MKFNAKSFVLSVAVFFLIIQVILQSKIPIFQYYDEVLTVFCLVLIIVDTINTKSKDTNNVDRLINQKLRIRATLLILLITLIGILGNIVFGIQSDYRAILMDIGNMFKSFITYIAFATYFGKIEKRNIIRIAIKYINLYCILLFVPGFFLAIVNLFFDIGMHTDYAYGLRCFHYIFLRVGNLYTACVGGLVVMTVRLVDLKGRKRQQQFIFILLTILLMISTLRTRAIIFSIIYIFGYLYFVKGKRLKVKIWQVICLSGIGAYVAYPKIQYYFASDTVARSVLLKYGIKTAKDYFPLGAGFGSYGTFSAKTYWSALYNQYGFSQYYGMSRDYGPFLTDCYWPAILGEFGYIGAILTLLLVMMITLHIYRSSKKSSIQRFAALFGMITMIISSAVSSSFFNTVAVMVMALIAIATKYVPLNQEMINE